MSKILLSFLQPVIAEDVNNLICYYEALARELQNCGNEVLLFNTYEIKTNSNLLSEKAKIVEAARNFEPDLIIAFNNQILKEIIEVTDCPIALFDADSIDLFTDIDLIAPNLERYFMITSYEGWDGRYGQLGFTKERICAIHPATAIKNENLAKTKNISFIGSNFNYENHQLSEYIKQDTNQNVYKALQHFWQTKDYDYDKILEEFCPDRDFTLFDIHSLFDTRVYVLSSVLDLGLNLYGMGWERLSKINPSLSAAFNKEPKFSLKHNQDLYNSSKINLSISHPQTNGYAFPWRIYDIMASSGMLISTHSDLLNKQTKGFVDIPMYDSPYEARDLCKKFLREDNLRAEISEASNKFIEKHGRWQSNFKTLQDFLGIKLLNDCAAQNQDIPVIKINVIKVAKKKRTSRLKNVGYAFMFLLSSLPLVEKLFSDKRKAKLYKSIEKNAQIKEQKKSAA